VWRKAVTESNAGRLPNPARAMRECRFSLCGGCPSFAGHGAGRSLALGTNKNTLKEALGENDGRRD
jgi:hypothetical protein